MMHEFVTYADGTLVAYSDIRQKENGEEYIIICFERQVKNGFDTVIFELPSYNIIKQDGNYTDKEIAIANATKLWITKSGDCILANNNSRIPEHDLNKIFKSIQSNFFYIVSEWENFYG